MVGGQGTWFHPVRHQRPSVRKDPDLLFRKITQAARVPERKLGFTRGQQTFSVKGQAVTILSFVGHPGSVSTLYFCCCSTKATTDNDK